MNRYIQRLIERDTHEIVDLMGDGEVDAILDFLECDGFGSMAPNDAVYLWGAFSERWACAACLVVNSKWLNRFADWLRVV